MKTDTTKKEISLNDKEYFDMFIGERVLKKDVFRSQGHIPVYSANVSVPFGYLGISNINYFSYDFLLWGIDGEFDFNLIPKGTQFATTDHCGTIRILNDKLMPEYVLFALKIQTHLLGFDRTLRPSLSNMAKVIISVPVDSNGDFDVSVQKEVSKEYHKIIDIQKKLSQESQNLQNIRVDIPITANTRDVVMSEIFTFPETNSRITKEFCQKHVGKIPVYGCSKSETSVLGFIEDKLDGLHYYQDTLAWNRNGSVGHVFYRNGRFTTNEDHRVLELKSEYRDSISLPYIRFVLENGIKKMGFGFTNKLGKSKMKDIRIQIPVKPNEQNKFDYERQEAIANKYEAIYRLQASLVSKVSDLSRVYVAL